MIQKNRELLKAMKMKLIAAAALAMTSSLSFAATVLTCDTSSATKMANTCLPEASLFVAGSSALGGNINAILPDLFDTTKRLIKIVDTSASGIAMEATIPTPNPSDTYC
jgi:hypothetical protein